MWSAPTFPQIRVMVSYSLLLRTRMLSQMSSPWILPTLSGLISCLERHSSQNLYKYSIFTSKMMATMMPIGFRQRRYFSVISSASGINNLLDVERSQSCIGARVVDTNIEASNMESSPSFNINSFLRISRVDRADAQKALFEYLHYTRYMNFTDAEHMSKNSPFFLQKLLNKLDSDQEIGPSLTRFLRYHPINEFEPFFESLGLKPDELDPLLPSNFIFLSNDASLIENFHVLCYYGVPRSKIGKMYKVSPEMFGYGVGVLSSKLRVYEDLGLSRTTIIKLVACFPELLVGNVNVDFLWVLEQIRSLGVELDLIRGWFMDKSRYNWKRISEMLHFLDRMFSNKMDLASLVIKQPRFLFDDSGKKIYVLVAMLVKLGLTINKILNLFLLYPRILAGNFTKYFLLSVHFLVDIGMKTGDISRIVSSHPQVLGSCFCKRPDVVLKSVNVSAKRLCEIIIANPSQFNNLVSRKNISIVAVPKLDTHNYHDKTTFLLKLGFVENSDELAKTLHKFQGRGDKLQERFDCLVGAGLDYHTVLEMVKLVPQVLNQSTDLMKIKLDYLLNHLGYPLESLAAFPAFLCYNMDKIKLRFSMFNWLKDQDIVPTRNRKIAMSTAALSSILACSDERFVKYFVNVHPEGPDVWERLKNSFSSN